MVGCMCVCVCSWMCVCMLLKKFQLSTLVSSCHHQDTTWIGDIPTRRLAIADMSYTNSINLHEKAAMIQSGHVAGFIMK